MKSSESVEALLGVVLNNSEHSIIREQAAKMLAKAGDESLLPFLEKLYISEEINDGDTKTGIYHAIERLKAKII